MYLFEVFVTESERALSVCKLLSTGSVGGNPDHFRPLKLPLFVGERESPGFVISQLGLVAPAALYAGPLSALSQQSVHGGPEDEEAVVKAPHVERGGVKKAVAVAGRDERFQSGEFSSVSPPVKATCI